MRRADRLFQIIQVLRRAGRPMPAEAISAELETSKRTIYRDIAALIAQRVPIRGEAGIGYVLEGGFDLPPLMLTPDEIEAAALGARWVMVNGDEALAKAAADLHAKIAAVLPDRMRRLLLEPIASPRPRWPSEPDPLDLARVRASCQQGQKLRLGYRDVDGLESIRTVWPVMVGFREDARVVIAWCELRGDFRVFRTDRIVSAQFLDEKHPEHPATLRRRWHAVFKARNGE